MTMRTAVRASSGLGLTAELLYVIRAIESSALTLRLSGRSCQARLLDKLDSATLNW